MKPVNFTVDTKDDGESYFIYDNNTSKYFNWRYRSFSTAYAVSEHIRKLWNECPLDRVRDNRKYFSFILERTVLTDISKAQIDEQWVPGFSHDTYQRSGY